MNNYVFTRFFFFSFFVAAGLSAHAQVCLWAKTAGTHDMATGSNTEGIAVVTDKSGNVYTAGNYGGSINFGTTVISTLPGIQQNMYLAKYDSSGTVLWVKSFGQLSDAVYAMAIDTSGNLFMAGMLGSTSVTFGTTTITNPNGNAIFLLKLDSSGSVTWVKSAIGPITTDPYVITDVTTDRAGNAFVTGTFKGTLTFGTVNLLNSNMTGTDVFVVKYGPSGSVVWAKSTHGMSRFDSPEGIATDRAGNVYITGSYGSGKISFDTDTLINPVYPAAAYVMFLAKYDPTGNVMWAQSLGDSNITVYHKVTGSGIAIDTNDNIYALGLFDTDTLTKGSTTLVSVGGLDILLARFNTSGGLIWLKKSGGTSTDYGGTITTDAPGNVYIGGEFFSPSLTFGTHTLTHNGMYVAKFNNAGNAVWAKDATSDTNTTSAYCIAHDAFGHLYATGHFTKPFSFDAVPLANPVAPKYHAYVAKFGNAINAVPAVNNPGSDIRLYPNPALNELNIAAIGLINTVNITDVLGHTVYKQELNLPFVQVNIAGLRAGVYFVRINGTEVRKFLKL